MIIKVFVNVCQGIKGILTSRYLSPQLKGRLLIDYFRLTLVLAKASFLKTKINQVTIKSFGYKINFDNFVTFLYLFNEIFCKEVYTPLQINTLYDVGANIGLVILWYKFFNPKLKVVAFEPIKENYECLLKNLKDNHIENVTTYKIALSDRNGTASFFAIKDNIQSLDSGLVLNQNLPHKIFKTKVGKLSEYIKSGPANLVKIDVEGAETEIFKDLFTSGKIKLLKNIIFESHFFNEKQRYEAEKLFRKLRQMGTLTTVTNSSRSNISYYFAKNKLTSND